MKGLHKLIGKGPQRVNLYENLMTGTHPIIYNRIRRLEKLEGIKRKDLV
jgi:Zn-dependent protease with chaperone function